MIHYSRSVLSGQHNSVYAEFGREPTYGKVLSLSLPRPYGKSLRHKVGRSLAKFAHRLHDVLLTLVLAFKTATTYSGSAVLPDFII